MLTIAGTSTLFAEATSPSSDTTAAALENPVTKYPHLPFDPNSNRGRVWPVKWTQNLITVKKVITGQAD